MLVFFLHSPQCFLGLYCILVVTSMPSGTLFKRETMCLNLHQLSNLIYCEYLRSVCQIGVCCVKNLFKIKICFNGLVIS